MTDLQQENEHLKLTIMQLKLSQTTYLALIKALEADKQALIQELEENYMALTLDFIKSEIKALTEEVLQENCIKLSVRWGHFKTIFNLTTDSMDLYDGAVCVAKLPVYVLCSAGTSPEFPFTMSCVMKGLTESDRICFLEELKLDFRSRCEVWVEAYK